MAEKEVKKNKHGGARKGSGRKKKHVTLTNHQIITKRLSELAPIALEVIAEGMKSKDKKHAKSCAEIILKKTVADKKETDVNLTGDLIIKFDKDDKGLL